MKITQKQNIFHCSASVGVVQNVIEEQNPEATFFVQYNFVLHHPSKQHKNEIEEEKYTEESVLASHKNNVVSPTLLPCFD
jgi:hypothetical protein